MSGPTTAPVSTATVGAGAPVPTLGEITLALLVDVRDGLVVDDPDELAPYLLLPDGDRARVADLVWHLERAGLVHLVSLDGRWRVTGAGAELLAEEAARVAAACCPCRGTVCDPGCTCPGCPKSVTELVDDDD